MLMAHDFTLELQCHVVVQHCRCVVLLSGGSSAELEVVIGISVRFSFRESEVLGCVALVLWHGAS